MENYFDRVNLSFLSFFLKKIGFCMELIEIIRACIAGLWITPLINGIPSEYFQSSQGLRQRFPLSPFLYILLVVSLSRNLEYYRRDHTLTGLSISPRIKSVNHSLFADVTLLMGGVSCIVS